MPKISKHGGPSHKGELRPTVPVVEVRVDVSGDERLADLLRQVVQVEAGGTVTVSGNDDTPTVEVTGSHLVTQDEGGEQPSPGSSSSASTPKPPTNSEQSKPARRKPARTMASRSGQDQTGSDSAPLMAGAKTEPTSAIEPDQAEQAP